MIDLSVLKRNIGDLEEDKLLSLLQDFAASHPSEEEARTVISACQAGMAVVGNRFENGTYFLGDLIYAGVLLTESFEILKPLIGSRQYDQDAIIVLGTVEGDLHDIGKNIFRCMADIAGFRIYDLGINQRPATFVAKVREIQPDILGLSGLLEPAINSMKTTVEALCEAGLRDTVKIIVGGAPLSERICHYIGADAFTTSATEGVRICQKWIAEAQSTAKPVLKPSLE